MNTAPSILDRLNAGAPTDIGSFDTPDEALDTVGALTAELQDMLADRLDKLDLPAEHKERAARATALWRPDIRFAVAHESQLLHRTISSSICITEVRTTFSLHIGQSAGQLSEAVDRALAAAIDSTAVPYMRPGQTVKNLLRRFQNHLDYTDTSETGIELREWIAGTLSRYFGLKAVRAEALGGKYGNADFFDIQPSPAVDSPITTIPAIVSSGDKEDSATERAELKGTLIIPEMKPEPDNTHDDKQ